MRSGTPYGLKGMLRAGAVGAALLFAAALPAQAQCLAPGQARQVVQSGQAMSPGQVAAIVSSRGAKLVDLQLCSDGGGYVYVLRVVTKRGQVREVAVDARTGRLAGVID